MLPLAILLTICAAVSGLPPKGCTSCKNVWQETVEHAGVVSLEKAIGSGGCFVQKATCTAASPTAFAFLQINFGQYGFGQQGAQTVEFHCNDIGQWTMEQTASGQQSVVTTISCQSA